MELPAFSTAAPGARLYAPLIQDPVYGYPAVNVLAPEKRAKHSLLNWMQTHHDRPAKSTAVFRQGID
jgi:hypothetical protein